VCIKSLLKARRKGKVGKIMKIIDSYTSKPGNSQRWWEGDTLYSKTVD